MAKMKKMEAEGERSAGDGDGEENVPTGAQIEGLEEGEPEGSDSDQED